MKNGGAEQSALPLNQLEMPMVAVAVIGSCFGDEGKGLMVDYFCRELGENTLVVRHNGGSQAGHTVVAPDGKRHVFSHFGAGTLAGCETFLSRYFIVNPFIWAKEFSQLTDGGVRPHLWVDVDAPLTTPFDMLINQEIEKARGDSRHGSCGLGINETISRNEHGEYATFVKDMKSPEFIDRLLAIRVYALKRLEALGLSDISAEGRERLFSFELIKSFMDACAAFRANVITTSGLLRERKNIVFEGAQGLLLDESHQWFPHVTRSKTGLTNAITLAKEIGIDCIKACYVTRHYMTRHGAGPFPTEDGICYPDETNAPNDWQGALRFGELDQKLLIETVGNDLKEALARIDVDAYLAVTCMDQPKITGSELMTPSPRSAAELARLATGGKHCLLSYGPSAKTIDKMQTTHRKRVSMYS